MIVCAALSDETLEEGSVARFLCCSDCTSIWQFSGWEITWCSECTEGLSVWHFCLWASGWPERIPILSVLRENLLNETHIANRYSARMKLREKTKHSHLIYRKSDSWPNYPKKPALCIASFLQQDQCDHSKQHLLTTVLSILDRLAVKQLWSAMSRETARVRVGVESERRVASDRFVLHFFSLETLPGGGRFLVNKTKTRVWWQHEPVRLRLVAAALCIALDWSA